MLLQIETRRIEPDITVLTLTGKITMGRECQKVEQTVKDLLQQNFKKLIFDITAVDHIDSTGVGILAYGFGAVTRAGGILPCFRCATRSTPPASRLPPRRPVDRSALCPTPRKSAGPSSGQW